MSVYGQSMAFIEKKSIKHKLSQLRKNQLQKSAKALKAYLDTLKLSKLSQGPADLKLQDYEVAITGRTRLSSVFEESADNIEKMIYKFDSSPFYNHDSF